MPLFGPADRWLVPAPSPERIDWLRAVMYAHRGLHGRGIPENSLAAFEAAAARGLGIELDVRLSRDGQAVVFHDAELDRMTGEKGLVAQRTAGELGRIALTIGKARIPTLRQALDRIAGRIPILIELKCEQPEDATALCLAVRRDLDGYGGQHAAMSFDPEVSRWFARGSPQTVRGLSFRARPNDGLRALARRRLAFWRARPDFLTCDIAGLPLRLAAHQRARGVPLLAWTIISAEQRAFAAVHADAVIAEAAGLDGRLA